MYHNLNQLQWQLERDNFHGHVSKTCLVYLEELDKFIDERALKYRELRIKESKVQAIKEIENQLKEKEIHQQESMVACLVTKGAALEACLLNEGNENRSFGHESTSSGNDAEYNIGPSYDSDTVSELPHSNNDTFENMFSHRIQSHEQPESIPDTCGVNENNSNIIYDIPNMDPDRDKEEHDDFDYEKQRDFFASLINNLKCDVNKCKEVNREAQQANSLLTNELERYKEKKYFSKDKTIESEYCKKIKILNDEISNLKSQACEKDKTFSKENGKYDEYVKPLFKRKNEHEKKNQEFSKQINDLDNRL
ncbi:hypothetical protein Tco_0713663 [Tanacetum coccineum]